MIAAASSLSVSGSTVIGSFVIQSFTLAVFGSVPAAAGADPTATSVRDWMTKDPITVDPDTDSDDAAAIMATEGFRHLPVVEGDSVVGVVSLRDVLSARIRRPAR